MTINLDELPLHDANRFWLDNQFISAYEKLKILCVTGGVPKYLEEINPKWDAEKNIKQLCFSPGGVLLEEIDRFTVLKQVLEKKLTQIGVTPWI